MVRDIARSDFWQGQNVLVTGGSGFIGGALVRKLTASGCENVSIFDKTEPKFMSKAKFIKGDIVRDIPRLAENATSFGNPFDIIFHCAAILGAETTLQRIRNTEEVNVLGTISVLQQFPNAIIIRPGLFGTWPNPYMISSKAAEQYGLVYRKYMGRKFVSVRFTVVYGPCQPHGIAQRKAVPIFIGNALFGKPIPIYGSGLYKVRLFYIDDAVRLLIRVAEKYDSVPAMVTGTSIAENNFISVLDLAKEIKSMTNSASEITHLPMREGQPESASDAGADVDKTRALYKSLSFEEKTNLEQGLRRTIDWFFMELSPAT